MPDTQFRTPAEEIDLLTDSAAVLAAFTQNLPTVVGEYAHRVPADAYLPMLEQLSAVITATAEFGGALQRAYRPRRRRRGRRTSARSSTTA